MSLGEFIIFPDINDDRGLLQFSYFLGRDFADPLARVIRQRDKWISVPWKFALFCDKLRSELKN
jgi:hypothetical protein